MGPGWAETGFVICSCSAIQSPDWRQQAQGFLGPRTALGCRQYDHRLRTKRDEPRRIINRIIFIRFWRIATLLVADPPAAGRFP